jgi:hypothetical protein
VGRRVQFPWRPYPSAITTAENEPDFPWLDLEQALGTSLDPPAVTAAGSHSAFSLLRGILVALGVPPGDGTEQATDSDSVDAYFNAELSLGDRSDPAATDIDNASAISLLKAIREELDT